MCYFWIWCFSIYLKVDDVKIFSEEACYELLKIEDIEASFVIYILDGFVNITSRSLGKFNV